MLDAEVWLKPMLVLGRDGIGAFSLSKAFDKVIRLAGRWYPVEDAGRSGLGTLWLDVEEGLEADETAEVVEPLDAVRAIVREGSSGRADVEGSGAGVREVASTDLLLILFLEVDTGIMEVEGPGSRGLPGVWNAGAVDLGLVGEEGFDFACELAVGRAKPIDFRGLGVTGANAATGFLSSFPSLSVSTFSVSPLVSFGLAVTLAGSGSFSFNASACLLLAVVDLVTLPSLDIGVGRAVPFVVFVRVTPLGPGFAVLERNLEVFVDFAAGSLESPGGRSFALPLPFSSDKIVSTAGGCTGVGFEVSGPGGTMEAGNSGEPCFSGGCGSDIDGASEGTGSGSGAGSLEALEAGGSIGYGSAGIGGSTETDLDREARREGGVGDLEGSRKDNGFGWGGMRCEVCLARTGLGSRS